MRRGKPGAWRLLCLLSSVVSIGILLTATGHTEAAPTGQLKVEYLVTMVQDDKPEMEVSVSGAPSGTTTMIFGVMGGPLGAISDLSTLFQVSGVTSGDGSPVQWRWGDKSLLVDNGSSGAFTLKYQLDALRLAQRGTGQKFAIFRRDIVFFVASDVFPLVQGSPEEIAVRLELPQGMTVFSTLDETGDAYRATRDLWGDLTYDFQKAAFTAGKPVMTAARTTEWGDKYIYLRLGPEVDRLPANMADPATAQEYMATVERIARYFRETIGPLPPHTILFGNDLGLVTGQSDGQGSGSIEIVREVDWFHFMQIWPIEGCLPEVAHHLFHAYSFWPSQSKLSFSGGDIDRLLSEGLATYFEQTVPTTLFGEEKYRGKLFELYVLNQRGQPFGIADNGMHATYNVPAIKVYLLEQYIRSVTGGQRDVTTFVRALWDAAKDDTEPQQLSEDQVIAALAGVVGNEKSDYLRQLAVQSQFSGEDFKPLLPAFNAYVDWLAGRFFDGNRTRFLLFLDIAAAKGAEWPHYATYPHQLGFRAGEGMQDFDAALARSGRTTPDKADILAALKAATGKDHSGFFEFWAGWGINLDPASAVAPAAAQQSGQSGPPGTSNAPQAAIPGPGASTVPQAGTPGPGAPTAPQPVPASRKAGWMVPVAVCLGVLVAGGIAVSLRVIRGRERKSPR